MSPVTWLQDQRRFRILSVLVLIIGIAWTTFSRVSPQAASANSQASSPREGYLAPDFTLDLLGGGQVTLSSLRGQVVMVNLWASWCPPCRFEMPAIEKVYRSYKDLGLVVLGVNTIFQDSEAGAAAFVSQYGLTFSIPLDRDGSVSTRYALRALPTTFFIDREGVIRSVVVGGPMSEALIQSKVEELLNDSL
jgi:cytochrome c biogenesis protein CcmG/thiol:disulfide interchange protein DsbE